MNKADKQHQSTITQSAMQQIKSGQITMRPHWRLALLAGLSTVALAAAAILTVYLVNLVAFKLRVASIGRPMYGARANFDYFAGNFPWLAFVIGLAGIGLLIWLVRKHDFSYRLGRWLLVAVVLFSLFTGTALAFTNLNNHLENFGPMQGIYGGQMHAGQENHGQSNKPTSPGQDSNDMMQRRGQPH